MKSFLSRAVAMVAFVLWASAPADAAPINYGDFSDIPPGSVIYLDVTETANTPGDDEPLFGGPSIVGNLLDFDPAGFSASAMGGTSDLTDGQLNFTLMAIDSAISTISFREGGDYSLLGTGGTPTQISYAIAIGSIVVLEIDGSALSAPVVLAGASASGGDTLGGGIESGSLWNLSLVYDVNAALQQAGVSFDLGATKIEIAVDDSLGAISEAASIAFIAKKDFRIDVKTVTVPVPEPALSLLLGLGLVGLASRRRR